MPGIYLITCTENNLVYIGATSRKFSVRLNEHWGELRLGTHGNPRLQHTYNKYGRSAFTVDILEECAVAELKDAECWYIEYFKYIGADVANSAKPNDSMYDPDVKSRIGQKNTGKKLNNTVRERMSKAQKEHYANEENRRAMSKATSKKVYPNIVSPDGIVYSTEWLSEFCRQHNLEYSGVRKLLTGKMKSGHYKGWYIEGQKPEVIRFSSGPRDSEWTAKQTINSENTKRAPDYKDPTKRTVVLLDPLGNRVVVTGIREFARQNAMNGGLLSNLVNGHISHYKGWTLVTEDELI